ncbi:signal peptidase I [Nitrosopumilus sp.]|nr:signal peptidase I [Nitrosopumilus sp.]
MAKRSISKGVIKDIAIVAIAVIVIWIGLQAAFGTQNPFYVVASGSMIPALEVYDIIVIQGHQPFEEVQVGDIIVFDRPSDHNRVIVHRVESILSEDPLTVRTQGDANPSFIRGTDYPITEEEYIGKVAYVIPQVGYITQILKPPMNYIIIAIVIGIMIIKQFTGKKKEVEDIVSKETLEELSDIGKIEADSEYSIDSNKSENSEERIEDSKQTEEKSNEDKENNQ